MEENLLDPLVNISHHYDLSDTPLTANLGTEPTQENHKSKPLRFGLPTDADGALEQEEEGTREPAVFETPRSVIKTSDTVNHLKAGDWS